jgi:hypothetical protein
MIDFEWIGYQLFVRKHVADTNMCEIERLMAEGAPESLVVYKFASYLLTYSGKKAAVEFLDAAKVREAEQLLNHLERKFENDGDTEVEKSEWIN